MAAEEVIKAVELLKEGNREGFDVLYSYTYNYVYSQAKYYMDNNEDDALELTQETYLQAYKGIHNLQDAGKVYAWLGAIVCRQSKKMFNKTKREALVNEEAEGIFENIECTSKDFKPEETQEEKVLVEVIKGMLEELPELQRQAVLAFYYDHMKIDEIAEAFECSPNTIKSRLNYAKQYLRDKILAHEKKYSYRLHTLTPATIYLAYKELFAESDYVLAAEKAQGLYKGVCSSLGLAPATIISGGTGAGTAATGATVGTTTAGTATGTGIGVKVAIGAAMLITTIGVTLGGLAATGNLSDENAIATESVQETETEIVNGNTKYISVRTNYDKDTGNYRTEHIYYVFDEEGRVCKKYEIEDDNVEAVVLEYSEDENGRVTKYINEDGTLRTVNYTTPEGDRYKLEQYTNGKLAQEYIYDEDGNTISYIRFDEDGNVLNKNIKEYDENGNVIYSESVIEGYPASQTIYAYEFDEHGRVIKEISKSTDGGEWVELYRYDDEKRLVMRCFENGDVVEEIYYDEEGREIKDITYNTTGTTIYEEIKYDEDGHQIEYKISIDDEISTHNIYTYETKADILARQEAEGFLE